MNKYKDAINEEIQSKRSQFYAEQEEKKRTEPEETKRRVQNTAFIQGSTAAGVALGFAAGGPVGALIGGLFGLLASSQ